MGRPHRSSDLLRIAALASLLGSSVFVLGCGSGTDGDAEQAESSTTGRRQRSEPPDEGMTAPSQSSGGGNGSTDADAELGQEGGQLGGGSDEPEAAGSSDVEPEEQEPPPARVFAACMTDEDAYEDCASIYVTMQQSEPPQCVQLTIDNCGTYGRRTLTVDAPAQWQLTSGSIGTNPDDCELGDFNASNTVLIDATGTIEWDEAAAGPTDLVLELTLEPSRTGGELPSVDIATSEPLNVAECPE